MCCKLMKCTMEVIPGRAWVSWVSALGVGVGMEERLALAQMDLGRLTMMVPSVHIRENAISSECNLTKRIGGAISDSFRVFPV
jgi:hypothetical protein